MKKFNNIYEKHEYHKSILIGVVFVISIIALGIGIAINMIHVKDKKIEYNQQTTTTTTTTTMATTKKTTKKVVPKNVVKYHITGYTYEDIKNYLHEQVLAYGWTEEDYNKVLYIMEHESTNPNSNINSQTKACGLAQAKPCKKVPKQYRQDWKYQIRWMLDYIRNRYKTVDKAYKYKKETGWY